MIDLHCHVLPGVDDGPDTIDESVALARAAAEAGTETIVATPHIDHAHGVEVAQIPIAVAALNSGLARRGVPVNVLVGGEIALTRYDELTDADLEVLGLGGGPYLLIESPYSMQAGDFDALIFEMRMRGHDIVLAHPERCPGFEREPDRLERLVGAGVLCSVTAGSIGGQFGRSVRTFSLDLVQRGLVHNVASDAHDHARRRPGLVDAFASAEEDLPGISAQAEWLTRDAPAAILAGRALPERPPLPAPPPARRRWWAPWRRG
jgi:protein-tyrosine phosphatase